MMALRSGICVATIDRGTSPDPHRSVTLPTAHLHSLTDAEGDEARVAAARLAALGGTAPDQLLRHPLVAGNAEGAHVLQRALAATFHHRHDVVGVPVAGAAKVPAK